MITRLTQTAIAVTDLARARAFYVDTLGFDVAEATGEALWLRAPDEFDRWSLKLAADQQPGLLSIGFRVAAAADLEELSSLHEHLGLAQRSLASGHAPGLGEGLRVRTPGGQVVDFHHQIEEVALSDGGRNRLPGRRTHQGHRGVAPSRIDHVNLRVPDFEAAIAYWRDHLAFSVSEYFVDPDDRPRIAWLRRAPFSHDVAIGRFDRPGFHHVAYAVRDAAALLRVADVVADAGQGAIEYGPGRHGVGDGFFLYIRDPDGNRLEITAGDYVRDLDRPALRWSYDDYYDRGLLWWGHKPPETFTEAAPVLERGLVDVV